MIIDPATAPYIVSYRLLLGSIVPRPIAFVSTISAEGAYNLAPFSFFNAICGEPPVVCFSSGNRFPPKDTLAIVVLFVVAAFLMLRYVSPASTANTTTTLPPSESTTTIHHTVAKSTVRVQVANGTAVPNLARTYSQELLTQGWNCLPGVNYTGTHEKSTIVYFNPGFKWAAIQIAHKIHLGIHSVQALNGLRPVPGASSDDVIVILEHNSAKT